MYWVVVNDPEKYLKESKTRVCYVFPASEGNKPANLAICWNNGHDFSNSFKGAKKDEPQEFLRLLLSFPDEAQESFHRLLLPAFVDTGTGLFTKLIFERPQPATEAQPVAASGTKKGKKTTNKPQAPTESTFNKKVLAFIHNFPCPLVYAVYSFMLLYTANIPVAEWKYPFPTLDCDSKWDMENSELSLYIRTQFWQKAKAEFESNDPMLVRFLAWVYMPYLGMSRIELRDEDRKDVITIVRSRIEASAHVSPFIRNAYLESFHLRDEEVVDRGMFKAPSLPVKYESGKPVLDKEWAPKISPHDLDRWEAANAFCAIARIPDKSMLPEACLQRIARQMCAATRQEGKQEDTDAQLELKIQSSQAPLALKKSGLFKRIFAEIEKYRFTRCNISEAISAHLQLFLRLFHHVKGNNCMIGLRSYLEAQAENFRDTPNAIQIEVDKLVLEAFLAHPEMVDKVKSARQYLRSSMLVAMRRRIRTQLLEGLPKSDKAFAEKKAQLRELFLGSHTNIVRQFVICCARRGPNTEDKSREKPDGK